MEFTDYIRFLAALAFVVGLIGMLALAARRFGLTPRITRKKGQRGSRLSIVDILQVDGKRRLVLLRRDDVDGFLDGVEAHSEACARATALEPSTLDAAAQRTFEQLHRVSSDLSDAIAAWQAAASERLAELRQARLATTAYSPLPPPPSVRSRGM